MNKIRQFKEWLIDWDANRADFSNCPIFTDIMIPKPFTQKGWLWDNIPLFFWIVLMVFYSIIFSIVIMFELTFIIIASLLFMIIHIIFGITKYAIWPLIQTIGISLIHPDGTAIEKIKNVWRKHDRFFHEDNKKSDYSKPFTTGFAERMKNSKQNGYMPLQHDPIDHTDNTNSRTEKQSMFENLTSDQMIEKFKENEKINHHTFQDNLQDKIKEIDNKD